MIISFIFFVTFVSSLITYVYNPNITNFVKIFGYEIRAIMIGITVAGLYFGYRMLKSN